MILSFPESAAPPGASDRGVTPLNRAPVAPIVLSSQDDMRTTVRVRYFSQALAVVRYRPTRAGILNLGGAYGLHSLIRSLRHALQKPRRVFAVLFRPAPLLVAVSHEQHSNRGAYPCLERVFPKTEKEFPRVA